MRASLALLSLLLSTSSLVATSPLELDPRDPENGCIALCGCCPCPCPDPSPPPTSTPPPPPPSSSAPPPPPSSSEPPPSSTVASGSQAEPSDFTSGEQPYRVVPDGTDPGTLNSVGTWLYGYEGCKQKNSAYKGNIDEAYYDSWTMANTDGVNADINWNEAAALEFLGAPGGNQPKQGQIQAVFANVATVIYSYKNPFQHYIHVRCDDPKSKCEKRPDNDPCNPVKPPPGTKPKPTPLAYSTNNGGDGYPLINFCDGFFKRRSLSNAIAYGTAQSGLQKFKLDNFDSRAQTFFHELTHLDLAADSPDPNPRVDDLTISVKLNDGSTLETVAYGPLTTKILARYKTNVGYYVQRNADNLAYFALAKYVMTKNGNIYPHLPIVTKELDGPPWKAPSIAGVVADFIDNNGLVLNDTSSDLSALELEYTAGGNDYPGCSDTLDPDSEPTLNIDQMADDSDYPDDYNNDVASWLSDLEIQVGSATPSGPAPSSSVAPSQAPAASSDAPPARTCDIDCGSELRPGVQPVCFCYCSDGQRFRITNSSPACK